MNWVKATDTQGDAGKIIGHHLYMDDGEVGDFSEVLAATGYPDTTDHTVAGANITTGLLYQLYFVSENTVGISASASDIATYYACLNPISL